MTYVLGLAWLLGVLGVALACLLSFAAAMKTVPAQTRRERAVAATLPLLTSALGLVVVAVCWPWQGPLAWITHLGPFVLATLGLMLALAPSSRRGSSLFEHDVRRLPDGRALIADSPRNWRYDEIACRRTAELEAQGTAPPGGAADWPSYWRDLLARADQFHENPRRYAELVHSARRAAGLADLPAV